MTATAASFGIVRPSGTAAKDPAEWITGDGPTTAALVSYLRTLSETSGSETSGEAFEQSLTKAEASMKIDALREKTGNAGKALRQLRRNQGDGGPAT